MTAGDTHPADDAGPEATPGPSAWWKRRSRLEKALIGGLIVIAAGFAWHFLAGGDSASEADISDNVKSSTQQDLDADSNFAKYHLVVEKVDVVKQTGNQYEGLATVRGPKGVDHQVRIEVTVDGDKSMWHTDPGAFVWAALEQLNPAAPATDSP